MSVNSHSNFQTIDTTQGVTLIQNIACLMTMKSEKEDIPDSTSPDRLGLQNRVDLVIREGIITEFGSDLKAQFAAGPDRIIDAKDWVVMPALVDAFAAPFAKPISGRDFVLRSQGLSPSEINKLGYTRAAMEKDAALTDPEQTLDTYQRFRQSVLSQGILTQSLHTGFCKTRNELGTHWAQLQELKTHEDWVHLHLTFNGPGNPDHVEGGFAQHIESLLDYLPQLAAMAPTQPRSSVVMSISADGFSKELGDKWLSACIQHGFDVTINADAESRSGGAELAAELAHRLSQTCEDGRISRGARVLSVKDARYSSDADFHRLSKAGISVILSPTSAFQRNEHMTEAARLRANGTRMVIATGYHPVHSPFHNLWFSSWLAMHSYGFSLPEVLAGITSEAAFALGLEEKVGHIAPNMPAKLIAFTGDRPEDFFASPHGEHLRAVIGSRTSHD